MELRCVVRGMLCFFELDIHKVRFWEIIWRGDIPLKFTFSHIFENSLRKANLFSDFLISGS